MSLDAKLTPADLEYLECRATEARDDLLLRKLPELRAATEPVRLKDLPRRWRVHFVPILKSRRRK